MLRSLLSLAMLWSISHRANGNLEFGRTQISKMAGCFAVDYTFSETQALEPNYKLDSRVYDATSEHDIYEWIVPLSDTTNEVHLQHIFIIPMGSENFIMKHQGETWTYGATDLHEYQGSNTWAPKAIADTSSWRRSILALDDGPRYACAASWQHKKGRDIWDCQQTYAPIPGRETRDMKRSDYQGLDRVSSIQVADTYWLERENNIKVREEALVKVRLVKEKGKIHYRRVADLHCAPALSWVEARQDLWAMQRRVWAEVLAEGVFASDEVKNNTPRYARALELENSFIKGEESLNVLETKFRQIISEYRHFEISTRKAWESLTSRF